MTHVSPMRGFIPFAEIREEDLARVGQKAFNLARLARGGFNVPRGGVLTTDVVDRIRSSAESAADDLVAELVPFIAQQCVFPLAVRSSAVGEDSATRSFAGIFRTRLNVLSLEQLAEAIADVAASASAPRVTHYADGEVMRMAIVLQEMVPAEYSGITFTANPVTGDAEEMILEYFNGLGEGIVSGCCTPHHIVADKDSLTIKETILSKRGVASLPETTGGIRTDDVSGDQLIVVDSGTMEHILRTSHEIERFFGSPQDIEWSITGDALHILQSRPVTTFGGKTK